MPQRIASHPLRGSEAATSPAHCADSAQLYKDNAASDRVD